MRRIVGGWKERLIRKEELRALRSMNGEKLLGQMVPQ
jgi:hypothetical protein